MMFQYDRLLIEKLGHIYYRDVVTSYKHINNLLLYRQQVEVWLCKLVKTISVDYWPVFSQFPRFAVIVDDKDQVGTGGMVNGIGHVSLVMELIEYLINYLMIIQA